MTYFRQDDLYHFNAGTATRLHDRLGAHPGPDGTHFAVWAPSARRVAVIGDFNHWSGGGVEMQPVGNTGLWHAHAPGVLEGALYKYRIETQSGAVLEKADPVAFAAEEAPRTASRVTALDYAWSDQAWMEDRRGKSAHNGPMSIYEVHLGSWQRDEHGQPLSYRELAPRLVDYVREMGFTHVELMPISEHPFYGSWGYQVTGYFAATSRYGSPQDLMYLIDCLHQADIGVILDWVPAHFPTDAHGLGEFDGTHLYEHADPRAGFHPDWKTYIFNYGRHEVRSFLLSSAIFWLQHYHIDGLRIDGVASMLYLDYSREEGEWIPNAHGGNHNLEAIAFLQQLNSAVYREFPDVQTIAEESTAFPQVSRPVHDGGLGFGYKWDMGWMHDTLEFFSRDPVYRGHHLEELTKRTLWAFSENFALPLSHDEVVHGKGSLLERMPGDEWQKFANLRTMLGHMFASPGKKLLFMGAEFGQWQEWNHDSGLEWGALSYGPHQGLRRLVGALNRLYRETPALHQLDCESSGFSWLHTGDTENSVLASQRRDARGKTLTIVLNLTPTPHRAYRLGVDDAGSCELLLDSDAEVFGGSGFREGATRIEIEAEPCHGRQRSMVLELPPLSASFYLHDRA